MAASIYERLGVPEVVNAVGYATRVGGSRTSEAVDAAMAEAQRGYVQIDELEAAADRIIGDATGAEAGIATSGAAAGLTLAAAACLAGLDTARMDELPDVSQLSRSQIVYPSLGRFHYDHAIRASGAETVLVDYRAPDALQRIADAIGPRTAAICYVWYRADERPTIEQLAGLAGEHDLPLIVDGAMSLPPVANLRGFIARGADLVTFSGGKHLGGPQASGVLAGRADLIRSAWLQMVDMDVRPSTWSLRHWVAEGWVSAPPRHGIGRSMKVGKEAVAGLLVALQEYGARDHAGELHGWRQTVESMARALRDLPGLGAEAESDRPGGQPLPSVRLTLEDQDGAAGTAMTELIEALGQRRPRIILSEDDTDPRCGNLYPMCLRAGEPEHIVAAIKAHLGA